MDDLSLACEEYQNIWDSEGHRIVGAWEKMTDYSFTETFVNAVVHSINSPSTSHPLALRDSLALETKKLTLVHEIGHRILYVPRREQFKETKVRQNSLENHKLLDLVLYDVYEDLYGKDFTDRAVVWDCEKVGGIYKEAWDFALSFRTKDERQKEFKRLMSI